MSQASRSHATAPARHLEQVARFIVSGSTVYHRGRALHVVAGTAAAKVHASTVLAKRMLDDDSLAFDVHSVRTAAEALLFYGRHWRRVQRRHEVKGGRPRRMSPVGDWADANPGEPWPHLRGHDLAFVRLARRVLAALDGQPSECQSCGGWGKPSEKMQADHAAHIAKRGPQPEMAELMRPCGSCNGTGHNLRGALPAVETSPQLRRRERLKAAELRRWLEDGRGGESHAVDDDWDNSALAVVTVEGEIQIMDAPSGLEVLVNGEPASSASDGDTISLRATTAPGS